MTTTHYVRCVLKFRCPRINFFVQIFAMEHIPKLVIDRVSCPENRHLNSNDAFPQSFPLIVGWSYAWYSCKKTTEFYFHTLNQLENGGVRFLFLWRIWILVLHNWALAYFIFFVGKLGAIQKAETRFDSLLNFAPRASFSLSDDHLVLP